MATGFVISPDGSQLSLYSGGTPMTHGGGGVPGEEGLSSAHSGILRQTIRRDGFVGLEAGYDGAHAPPAQWPQMLTVPLTVPNASLCASKDVVLHANVVTGVSGGAYFQLEQNTQAVAGFELNKSVVYCFLIFNARRHGHYYTRRIFPFFLLFFSPLKTHP